MAEHKEGTKIEAYKCAFPHGHQFKVAYSTKIKAWIIIHDGHVICFQ